MLPDDILDLALSFTLRENVEGGYVDDPRDPGGATNHGITQATYDVWLQEQCRPHVDIQNISMLDVRAIYRDRFWMTPHFDRTSAILPASTIAMFDWYLNGGRQMELAAIEAFQRRVGVIADGNIGGLTVAAAGRIQNDLVLAQQLCQDRQAYDDIHTGTAFIHGITNRINNLRDFLDEKFNAGT